MEQLVVWPLGFRDTSYLLKCPVSFTGVMLLGAEEVRGFFVTIVRKVGDYRIVREVRFDEGSVIEDVDRSQEMEKLRAQHQDVPLWRAFT
jgi:hypothetical protein